LRKFLADKGYNVDELHGDMAQSARTKTLQKMKDGQIDLLVCSDVAGRGIDIEELSHVFNYDVPHNADDYVHRIGRTGRAGHKGRAWMLATPKDQDNLEAIESLIDKKIEVAETGGKSKKAKSSETKPKEAQSKKDDTKPDKGPKSKGSGKTQKAESSKKSDKKPDKKSDRPQKKSGKEKARQQGKDNETPQGFGDDIPRFFGTK